MKSAGGAAAYANAVLLLVAMGSLAWEAIERLRVPVQPTLYMWTHWGWLDPVASLAIAVVIVLGTWQLFRQSLHLMFDGVPDSVDLTEVRAYLLSQPGVEDVHDLHIWAISNSDIALSVHLLMPGGYPGEAFIDAVTSKLHDRFEISHPTIQIETSQKNHGCEQPLQRG